MVYLKKSADKDVAVKTKINFETDFLKINSYLLEE